MCLNIIQQKSFFLICIIYSSPQRGEDSIAFIYKYIVTFLKIFLCIISITLT
jgi:hypothetical protein